MVLRNIPPVGVVAQDQQPRGIPTPVIPEGYTMLLYLSWFLFWMCLEIDRSSTPTLYLLLLTFIIASIGDHYSTHIVRYE